MKFWSKYWNLSKFPSCFHKKYWNLCKIMQKYWNYYYLFTEVSFQRLAVLRLTGTPSQPAFHHSMVKMMRMMDRFWTTAAPFLFCHQLLSFLLSQLLLWLSETIEILGFQAFQFSRRTFWRKGLKFGMLVYLEHLQLLVTVCWFS